MSESGQEYTMKRIASVFVVFGLILHLGGSALWARSTTEGQAADAVAGWLKADSRPLGVTLGETVAGVTPYADRTGAVAYYVVSLEPAGFVVVSADDRIEPIIAYAESGAFDPSVQNPLGALVSRDLPARAAAVRRGSGRADEGWRRTRKQKRWRQLTEWPRGYAGTVSLQSEKIISDVRVAPLIQSRWSQSSVCGNYCYNYYTPNHYPCGCVATAFAQIMRYHQHPTGVLGVHEFMIEVDEIEEMASTRGGDGFGGPYRWDFMSADPRSDCGELASQHRQAIGALCYDVGIAANMSYASDASGAYFEPIAEALMTTFGYGNALTAVAPGADQHFRQMVNPNLDAYLPVALGINDEETGHAVVADGYGYIGTTLYHHLNFGWAGSADAWYNLPDFSGVSPAFTVIDSCTYNIYATGSGAIISGRVTDAAGRPVPEAVVAAQRAEVRSGGLYTTTTNEQGIYALAKIPGRSTYVLTVSQGDTEWPSKSVAIRGNRWAVDFRGAAGRAHPEVLFVDAEAAGANDGTSWADAFVDLQDALVAADWSQDVNQVWVADGTYYPDRGAGERALSFALPDGVALYGGFAGLDSEAFDDGETALDQRDSSGHPTVLSGDLEANDGAGFRNGGDNSVHVVTAVEVGDRTVLDGFTITGGNANASRRREDARGGGVLISDASVSILNCDFVRNAALTGGGGACVLGESSPLIVNCRFLENRAVLGGGIAHEHASSILSGCVFAGNTSTSTVGAGGAVFASGAPPVLLANCTLVDNGSAKGGGLFIKDSTAAMTNCILWNNRADEGAQIDASSSTISVGYCNIDGGLSSVHGQDDCVLDWGAGNISTDPLFVDAEAYDLHILLKSPCIDAGDPDASLEWGPYDIDGQERISDGRIDIGADESSADDFDDDA